MDSNNNPSTKNDPTWVFTKGARNVRMCSSKENKKEKEKGGASTSHSNNLQKRTYEKYNSTNNLGTGKFDSLLEDVWSKSSKQKRKSSMYLDSSWFYLYRNESRKNDVLKWIKEKPIFSKTYVFIPILCGSHWKLLIFCHLGDKNEKQLMLLLNSLMDTNLESLEKDIRSFIYDIYEIKERKMDTNFIQNIPLLIPKVPQQKNCTESGFYVLYYIYLFIKRAPVSFTLKEYPYFLKKDWFSHENFEKFCSKMTSYSTNKKTKTKSKKPKTKSLKDLLCKEKDNETSKQEGSKKEDSLNKGPISPISFGLSSFSVRRRRSNIVRKGGNREKVGKEPNKEMQHGSQSTQFSDKRSKEPNKEMQHGSQSTQLSYKRTGDEPQPCVNKERAHVDPTSDNRQESAGDEANINKGNSILCQNENSSSMECMKSLESIPKPLNSYGPLIEANPNFDTNPIPNTINSNQSSIEPSSNFDTDLIPNTTNLNGSLMEANPNFNSNPTGSLIERDLQNPGWFSLSEDSPIEFTPDMWKIVATLKVVKRTPQMPHFKTLERINQQKRIGAAFCMILTYIKLTESMKTLSFDDVEELQAKIAYLDILEENGFNIHLMRTILKGVLEIKSESKLVELKKELSVRERDCDRDLMMLGETETKIADLKRQECDLAGERNWVENETEKLLTLIAENENEILRMKNQLKNMDHARERFARVRVEFAGS